MHASFEGDLDALETLRLNGCDLRQKFEWVLQDSPSFSLVHAAAFNGQEAVLRYLRTLYPPSFMREIDATGSNALHVTLDSSRDLIDTLKSTVPIWKHQVFVDGSDEWVGTP